VSRTRFARITRILNQRQPDLTLVMENVHKPHNLAAIARTCDAIGILEIHAITNRQRIALRKKAASGAAKWLSYRTHTSTRTAYDFLRQEGFNIYATGFAQDAIDFRQVDFTRPTALVVGAELEGITAAALSGADAIINIPMFGMAPALNVSVASAVILFEANRQRKAAGFYQHRRLDEQTYRRLQFEWMHPELSAYCRKHNLAYPELDGDGELLQPLTRHPMTT
jgi:tRNA (guanosine-2'-O-)-methyltransferase